MESISVFDMLKIGIGPSSSHTLGPWRAAQLFTQELLDQRLLDLTVNVHVHLYGSLALTGRGHGTDVAILLGLTGADPVTIPTEEVHHIPAAVSESRQLELLGGRTIAFHPDEHLHFHFSERLPYHANGLRFEALGRAGERLHEAVFYSIGGGFVHREGEKEETIGDSKDLPFPVNSGEDILRYCKTRGIGIAEMVYHNERTWRSGREIHQGLTRIWEVMKQCVYHGCHTEGALPGGLNVNRRAPAINRKLLADVEYGGVDQWIKLIRHGRYGFSEIIKWIGCFAMAVNEENASFGRVVTAPTNGAAGVIPAVMFYYICFSGKQVIDKDIVKFLLVAGEVGSLFKKGSTISAAMGGCQAEIGVSSAMAAAALTEGLGGNCGQALMAAEIAMEHHLGLTCDPVGGLVQIPCIERNSMGAVKAITAAKIALESDPSKARVSLDDVIKTMWETAQDMHAKYKETSQGGLATNISIMLPEC